jgi:PAS domain S-box-containing protein
MQALCDGFVDQPIAAMITELDGTPIWFNHRVRELPGMAGIDRFEMQRTILKLGADLQKAADGGGSRTGKIQWTGPDGREVEGSFAVTFVYDDAKLPICTFWTLAPDYEGTIGRARAIEETRYSAVVAAMEEGVVFQDSAGAIVLCNRRAEEILGLSREQMSGRTSLDPRWSSIHEDFSPFPGETHPSMVTLATGENQSNVVMGVHKPDGELTWISINSRAVAGSGVVPPGVVTTFHDITERKVLEDALRRKEEQFSQGFLASPAIMSLTSVGSDGVVRIVNVNDAFERQSGYRRNEAIGKTVQELGLWADSDALAGAVQHFRTHGSIEQMRFRFRSRWGQVRTAMTSVNTVELGGRMFAVANIILLGENDAPPDSMRMLFETNSEPLLVISSQLRVREANAAARAMLGYTIDELWDLDPESLVFGKVRDAGGRWVRLEDRGVSVDRDGDQVRMAVLREVAAVN